MEREVAGRRSGDLTKKKRGLMREKREKREKKEKKEREKERKKREKREKNHKKHTKNIKITLKVSQNVTKVSQKPLLLLHFPFLLPFNSYVSMSLCSLDLIVNTNSSTISHSSSIAITTGTNASVNSSSTLHMTQLLVSERRCDMMPRRERRRRVGRESAES